MLPSRGAALSGAVISSGLSDAKIETAGEPSCGPHTGRLTFALIRPTIPAWTAGASFRPRWPVPSPRRLPQAQQAGRTWRIGVLSFTSFPGEESRRIEAFRQGLRDLGYVEGQNLAVEYRCSGGKGELLPALAGELVRVRVGVIATYGTKATQSAKQAEWTSPRTSAKGYLRRQDPQGCQGGRRRCCCGRIR